MRCDNSPEKWRIAKSVGLYAGRMGEVNEEDFRKNNEVVAQGVQKHEEWNFVPPEAHEPFIKTRRILANGNVRLEIDVPVNLFRWSTVMKLLPQIVQDKWLDIKVSSLPGMVHPLHTTECSW